MKKEEERKEGKRDYENNEGGGRRETGEGRFSETVEKEEKKRYLWDG